MREREKMINEVLKINIVIYKMKELYLYLMESIYGEVKIILFFQIRNNYFFKNCVYLKKVVECGIWLFIVI